MRPDTLADPSALAYDPPRHPIWYHPEITDALRAEPSRRKRLAVTLQRLAASGRTTAVKGCRDPYNRGWLRSPLGGNNGMHYYLWWAPAGNQPVKGMELPRRSIVVRAARHHDDHSPLAAGDLDEHIPLDQRALDDPTLVGDPWTPEQLRFITAEEPVRLLSGLPGAGKTTTLWKAVGSRSAESVLYLTWSSELAQVAAVHFASNAPRDVRVHALDFLALLGELLGVDVVRRTPAESEKLFRQAIGMLGPKDLGPWVGRKAALYAETRAYLLGRAQVGADDPAGGSRVVRLGEAAYLALRGTPEGIGAQAAEYVLRVVATIGEAALARIFPELAAAAAAVRRLRAGELPAGLADFDRIVVDEIQDLTLLESTVIVELCAALARRRGFAPWLLLAGDDGQTVRPSGFGWGPLSELVAARLRAPQEFRLEESLRCPERVAAVIERASAYYGRLQRRRRPTKQYRGATGSELEGRLFHVETGVDEAVALLRKLDESEGVMVIAASGAVPSWVPPELRKAVQLPAQVKGLEYQSVCLLNPGRLLAGLEPRPADGGAPELEASLRRTAIDRLRVALSRSTESLAFVDVDPTEAERRLSAELIGEATRCAANELAEYLANRDWSLEERLLARIEEVRAFGEDAPELAWRRACQAVRLLAEAASEHETPEPLSAEVYQTWLALAARNLVRGDVAGAERDAMLRQVDETLAQVGRADFASAFARLRDWLEAPAGQPFDLLDAALALGDEAEWLAASLVPVAQRLRQAIADGALRPQTAARLAGDVAGWLRLTGDAGDVAQEVRRLRAAAVDTLLDAGDTAAAEALLGLVQPTDWARTARLREVQGRLAEAAELYERAGARVQALRNWRRIGAWERALPLADADAAADLQWLADLEALLARRPAALDQQLTPKERERLQALLARLAEDETV